MAQISIHEPIAEDMLFTAFGFSCATFLCAQALSAYVNLQERKNLSATLTRNVMADIDFKIHVSLT